MLPPFAPLGDQTGKLVVFLAKALVRPLPIPQAPGVWAAHAQRLAELHLPRVGVQGTALGLILLCLLLAYPQGHPLALGIWTFGDLEWKGRPALSLPPQSLSCAITATLPPASTSALPNTHTLMYTYAYNTHKHICICVHTHSFLSSPS